MFVGLNSKTIKFYFKKLATDFYIQPSYYWVKRTSLKQTCNKMLTRGGSTVVELWAYSPKLEGLDPAIDSTMQTK